MESQAPSMLCFPIWAWGLGNTCYRVPVNFVKRMQVAKKTKQNMGDQHTWKEAGAYGLMSFIVPTIWLFALEVREHSFTVHCSLFTVHCSLFTVHCGALWTPRCRLPCHVTVL